jgi:CBS domain-containing protein
MSPRAACRLEILGFTRVYDYVLGKADWLAHGLATEGEQAGIPRAKDLLREDVVTARPDERIGPVREQVVRSGYGFALVVAEGGVLLGRLRRAALDGDADARAERVMEPGPATVRADIPVDKLVERMRRRDLQALLVTTPQGRLLGVVRRQDAEAHAGSGPESRSRAPPAGQG